MIRYSVSVFILALAILASVVAWTMLEENPSTAELEADLAATQTAITEARTESAEYSSGAIKVLIEARLAVLRHTEAMLEQKRRSLLRRISLDYRIDAQSTKPADQTRLRGIESDIAAATQDAERARIEGSKYSGGLLQATALMSAATNEMRIAQLRLEFASAKYGLPIFQREDGGPTKSVSPPGRETVKDKDAL